VSSGERYTDEFKIEAVKQVTDHRYSVAYIANDWGPQHIAYMHG